jgi:hypothetical protein
MAAISRTKATHPFLQTWLRRIVPDTHQDQASPGMPGCPGGFAAPEEHW